MKPAALLGIIFFIAFILSLNITYQSLWYWQRPATYYVEILDVRHGERYITSAIVSYGEILYSQSDHTPNNLSIFTVEQIFELAAQSCDVFGFDCVTNYNMKYFYIRELSIPDWRVIRVIRFECCLSYSTCPTEN
jgi:hypothetical protein